MWISLAVNVGMIWIAWPLIAKQCTQNTPHKRVIDPVKVQVDTVKREPIARKKTMAGMVKAADSVALTSEVSGRVKEILCRQGDKVKKGDILIQLDDAQAQAQLQEASAQVKVTTSEYRRQKILDKRNYTSKASLEKAEAALATALAARAKAAVYVDHMKIKAPFDGEIGLFSISEGAQINQGQDITRLVRSDPMNVEFQVPESEVKDIHVDDEVQVLVEHADVLPVTAIIKAKEPYADPTTHSTRVIASLDNSEGKFRDGSFASVTLFLSRDDQAIVVPKESITRDGEQDFVYIVVDGRARQRPVIVSFQDKGKVKVEGVSEGDIVVTDPVELLVDGIPVQVEASQ